MPFDSLSNAAALPDFLLASACLGILMLGIWILRNPAAFWDQFNPYLKPYGALTLLLGRTIGSLWAFGAVFGCVMLLGNAVRAGLQHHWI
jgi:hypothetical protein